MFWNELLKADSQFDGSARLFAAVLLFLWLLLVATPFEYPYPDKLVELYQEPWWRILLVLLLFFALMWCPRVGVLSALTVYFYLHDVGAIVQK